MQDEIIREMAWKPRMVDTYWPLGVFAIDDPQ